MITLFFKSCGVAISSYDQADFDILSLQALPYGLTDELTFYFNYIDLSIDSNMFERNLSSCDQLHFSKNQMHIYVVDAT
jgi:hypothetical protein